MNYSYVEFARAKRALRIVAILLGLFLLAAIVVRISVHDTGAAEGRLINSPTAHVTRTQLPGGATRTVVDDPSRSIHAVILKHVDGSLDMDITEPKTDENQSNIVMGSMTVNRTAHGNMEHTVVHYAHGVPAFPLGYCFLFTIPMGLIVASLLGGPLAKENDGHLELAWTKPVSRERYALGAIAVDAATIAVSQIFTLALALLATLMFLVPKFSFGDNMGWHILMSFAGPISWYALVTAASASLKRGPGVVIGLGWVAALLIPSIAQGLAQAASVNQIAAGFLVIFKALSYLDPIAYMTTGSGNGRSFLLPFPQTVWVMCLLAAVYVALAVAQWRRVEA